MILEALATAALEAELLAGYRRGEEACGLLEGPGGPVMRCDRVIPLSNLATRMHQRDPVAFPRDGRTSFAILERRVADLVFDAAERGREVRALYHSHLDCEANLSAMDAAILSGGVFEAGRVALGPGPRWPLVFVVSSVHGGHGNVEVREHRAFRWTGGGFDSAPIYVEHGGRTAIQRARSSGGSFSSA